MSVTLTRVANGDDVFGRTYVKTFDVTLDTSYPGTAGYVIKAQDVGLRGILGAAVIGGNKAAGALTFWADLLGSAVGGTAVTQVALRAFQPTGGGGTNPTTLQAPKVSSGASTASAVDATTPTIVPGIAKEVADTTSLSAMVVRLQFFGY